MSSVRQGPSATSRGSGGLRGSNFCRLRPCRRRHSFCARSPTVATAFRRHLGRGRRRCSAGGSLPGALLISRGSQPWAASWPSWLEVRRWAWCGATNSSANSESVGDCGSRASWCFLSRLRDSWRLGHGIPRCGTTRPVAKSPWTSPISRPSRAPRHSLPMIRGSRAGT